MLFVYCTWLLYNIRYMEQIESSAFLTAVHRTPTISYINADHPEMAAGRKKTKQISSILSKKDTGGRSASVRGNRSINSVKQVEFNLKHIYGDAPDNKHIQRQGSKNCKSFISLSSQTKQNKLKKEIEKELSYRKFIQRLKQSNYAQRKQLILQARAKKAKQANKLIEKKCKEKQDQQKLKNEQIFNQMKTVVHPNWSIWARKPTRQQQTSSRVTGPDSIIYHYDKGNISARSCSRDFIISERTVHFDVLSSKNVQKKPQPCLQLNSRRKNVESDQILFCSQGFKQKKFLNVIKRRQEFQKLKQKQAIQKAVKKNMYIESIHNNKRLKTKSQQSDQDQEKEKIQKMNKRIYKKPEDEADNQSLLRLLSKLDEKQKKKLKFLQRRSQKARHSILESRERFLRRKQQLNQQNYAKIEKQYQNFGRDKVNTMNQEKNRNLQDLKTVQKVIRKTREKIEEKQALSEQIVNLKKLSNGILMKKLREIQKETSPNQSYY